MTSNLSFLQDELSKRIARGSATARDLTLLGQLMRCQRRNCLIVGAALGAALATTVLGVANVLVFA